MILKNIILLTIAINPLIVSTLLNLMSQFPEFEYLIRINNINTQLYSKVFAITDTSAKSEKYKLSNCAINNSLTRCPIVHVSLNIILSHFIALIEVI